MYKTLMLAVVLVASASWLQAQAYPQPQSNPASPSQTMPDQTSSQASDSQTTVQGCLQGSSGNYTLTDKSGTMYQLTGNTAKLADHVGHEVQITGSTSAASSSTPSSAGAAAGSMSGAAGSQQSIDVKSFKHISQTCSSGAK